jgi:hypothetical protein
MNSTAAASATWRGLILSAGAYAHPGRGESQHRAQPLAAGCDNMSGELRDQRHRTLHALDDQRVDVREIRAQ